MRYGLAITLAGLAFSASAQMTAGMVVAVHDGDTMTVLVGKSQVRVRLADIDAPELGQPFGERSKQALSTLCFGKQAQVEPGTRDRYGRTVAHVSCEGKDAATGQVLHGFAWVFRRYAAPGSVLYLFEGDAKRAGRGLWSDSSPVPPWEWRSPNKAKR